MGKKKFEEVSPTSALDADLLAGAASASAPPPPATTPTRHPTPEASTEDVVERSQPEGTPAPRPDEAERRDETGSDGSKTRVRPGLPITAAAQNADAEGETPRQGPGDEKVAAIDEGGASLAEIQGLQAKARDLLSRQAAMKARIAELLERQER